MIVTAFLRLIVAISAQIDSKHVALGGRQLNPFLWCPTSQVFPLIIEDKWRLFFESGRTADVLHETSMFSLQNHVSLRKDSVTCIQLIVSFSFKTTAWRQ